MWFVEPSTEALCLANGSIVRPWRRGLEIVVRGGVVGWPKESSETSMDCAMATSGGGGVRGYM